MILVYVIAHLAPRLIAPHFVIHRGRAVTRKPVAAAVVTIRELLVVFIGAKPGLAAHQTARKTAVLNAKGRVIVQQNVGVLVKDTTPVILAVIVQVIQIVVRTHAREGPAALQPARKAAVLNAKGRVIVQQNVLMVVQDTTPVILTVIVQVKQIVVCIRAREGLAALQHVHKHAGQHVMRMATAPAIPARVHAGRV